MKSQNDIYHGDEHITDKPKKYLVTFTKVFDYAVYVDAFNEDEAHEQAFEMVCESPETFEVDNNNGFYLNDIMDEE